MVDKKVPVAVYVNQSRFAQLAGMTRQAVSKAVNAGRIHKTKKGIDLDHPGNRYILENSQSRAAGLEIPPAPPGPAAAPAAEPALAVEPGGPPAPPGPAAAPAVEPGTTEPALAPAPEPAPGAAMPPPFPPAGPPSNQRPATSRRRPNGLTRSVLRQLDLSSVDETETGKLYKGQVDVLKAVEQTRGLQLKNETLRNELISRDLVKRYFAELYTVETTELLTLGEKLAPEFAARFGLDDQNAIVEVTQYIQVEISNVLEHIENIMNRFLKAFPAEEN